MRNLLIVIIFLAACTLSCKSTKKLYEKGQYDKALYSALDDIRKNPNNATAAHIIPNAYGEAVAGYESNINAAKNVGTPTAQKLDIIYQNYAALQKMYNAITATPAANGLVNAKNYSLELSGAAEDAATFRYEEGLKYLEKRDRLNARKAYENLVVADNYVPGYKDVVERKQEAYDLAIMNVVVNKFDQRFGYYSINGSFFENDILRSLNNIGNSYYYKFYGINQPGSRDVRVDQYMELNMYDIWFGSLATNTYSYDVSKSITVPDEDKPKTNKSITVTATIRVTRRIIDSRGVMDYRITDAATQRMITYDRVASQYTWEKLTGNYSGDSRALSDKDWAIVRGAYNNQPSYDELYRELTRQIMNEFNYRMRSIYAR
jgi:hypothetical protein